MEIRITWWRSATRNRLELCTDPERVLGGVFTRWSYHAVVGRCVINRWHLFGMLYVGYERRLFDDSGK